MAAELGVGYISIIPETSKVAGSIKQAFSSAGAEGDGAGKSAGGGFFKGFGGILTAAAGALSVGSFFKGAITGAGDLQQSAGAISTVFKENAGDMLKWSQTADSALGLTQNEYNELGTIIGSQLKNGGTAMDELAPKTNSLITTGADLASMFGGSTTEAVEALSSALKGERDPIERYGVSLNQAAIDAKAAELGFSKVGGTLSQEASQAATMALIMEQTADATGNFAKESDTLAGQQQRMSAGFKDVQTSIGGLFLPVLTDVFGFINTNILPSLDKFVSSLGSGGLAGAFGPVMAVAGPLFSQLAASFGPLIPQVVALITSFSPLGLLFQVITPILPMLSAAFTQIAGSIAGVLAIVIPLVTQIVSALVPIIVNLVSTVLPPLATMFGTLIAAIAPFIVQIAGDLIPIVNALLPVVVTVFNVIAQVITAAMQIVQGIIQVVTGIISGNWSQVWEGIGNILSGVWNTIVTVVRGALQIIGQVVMAGLSGVASFVGSVLGNIGRFFADTWNNVVNGVSSMIGNVVGFFSGLIGRITGAIGNAGRALWDTGVQIIQGLINGIGSMMGSIGRAVLNIVPEAIRGPFEDLLGIHSPSRVFRDYGVNIGQGLILGIDGMHDKVADSVTGLVSVPSVPAFSTGSLTAVGALGAAGAGVVNNWTINQVDDPIGTAHAVARRQTALAV